MENPYEAPLTGPSLADDPRRPVGVAVLSGLAAVCGSILLVAILISAVQWRETNDWAINRRMAPSIFWTFTGMTLLMALAASFGMWRGHKWAWWLTCGALVLFVINDFGRGVTTIVAHNASLMSPTSFLFFLRGIFFGAILAYWLRTRVRKFFHTEQTSRIKAILLSAAGGIGLITVVTGVLQTIFLFRAR